MSSTEQEFKQMTDNIMAGEANALLDKYLLRTENWQHNMRMDGMEPSLADLMRKLMTEKSERHHLVVALSAALWRLRAIMDGNPDD